MSTPEQAWIRLAIRENLIYDKRLHLERLRIFRAPVKG